MTTCSDAALFCEHSFTIIPAKQIKNEDYSGAFKIVVHCFCTLETFGVIDKSVQFQIHYT